MVSSPIGGFMPIPLAIMPPFMAYQSLLMGDAFGKGFQYGKRKISAMTNEEFNNMSLPNLFKDSMAEYESMIPTVEKAMDNSTKLQNSIIERMLKILPELLGSFFQGGTDAPITGDSPFLKNQTDVAQNATIQAMQATIQNIRYTTDRNPVFNQPAVDELQKLLDKLTEQSGTKESLAEKIENEKNPSPPPEIEKPSHVAEIVKQPILENAISRKLRIATNKMNSQLTNRRTAENEIVVWRRRGSIQDRIRVANRLKDITIFNTAIKTLVNQISQLQAAHLRTYKKYWSPP